MSDRLRVVITCFVLMVFGISLSLTGAFSQDGEESSAPAPGSIKWVVNTGSVANNVAISDSNELYLSHGWNNGALSKLTADGDQLWYKDLSGFRANDPPTLTGKDLVLQDGAEDKTLYAFNTDGSLEWTFKTHGRISRSAVVDKEGRVFLTNRIGEFYVLNLKDGSMRRKINFNNRGNVQDAKSPAIGPDGTVFVGVDFKGQPERSGDVEITDGRYSRYFAIGDDGIKWKFLVNGRVSAPAISRNGSIYFGTRQGKMFKVGPNGELKWQKKIIERNGGFANQTSPVIDENGTVYFGGKDGDLSAISSDGTIKWKRDLGEEHVSGYGMVDFKPGGFALGSDKTVYVNADHGRGGNILAFTYDGRKKWHLPTNSRNTRHPNIADNTLYTGRGYPNDEDFIAINISSQSLANAPWPSFQNGKYNRGRQAPACTLDPKAKILPSRIHTHPGAAFLFVTGFEDSENSVTSIKPESLTLAEAQPEWWLTIPSFFGNHEFMVLKYRRNELDVDNGSLDPRTWTKTELPIEGELEDGDCFKDAKKAWVRP